MNVIAFSVPAFFDPRGSLVPLVLVSVALYALLATGLNALSFFWGRGASAHPRRDVVIAALMGTMTLFLIVTMTIALRILAWWMFEI